MLLKQFFLVYASAAISTCLEAPDSQFSDRLSVLLLPHNPSTTHRNLEMHSLECRTLSYLIYYKVQMK